MAQKLTGGIENFGGGLNTAKPAHQLAENEIRIAQWVDVGPDGAADKAKGPALYEGGGLGTGSGIQGLYVFNQSDGSEMLLTAWDQHLYKIVGGVQTQIPIRLYAPVAVGTGLGATVETTGAVGANLAVSGSYYYRVVAVKGAGKVASADIAATETATPHPITLKVRGSYGADTYEVYRKTGAGGTWGRLASGLTHADTDVGSGRLETCVTWQDTGAVAPDTAQQPPSDNTTELLLPSGAYPEWQTLLGRVYFIAGDGLLWTDGTDAGVVAPDAFNSTLGYDNQLALFSAPHHACTVLAEHQNYLFLAGGPEPTKAYYSLVGKPGYFTGLDLVDAPAARGGRIVSMEVVADALAVSLTTARYTLHGNVFRADSALFNANWSKASSVGVTSGRAVALLPMGGRDVLIAPTSDRNVSALSTDTAVETFLSTRTAADHIRFCNDPDVASLANLTDWAGAVATYHKGRYIISFPGDSQVWVGYPDRRADGALAWYGPRSGVSLSCFATLGDGTLLAGDAQTGKVYEFESGYTLPDGSAYTYKLRTRTVATDQRKMKVKTVKVEGRQFDDSSRFYLTAVADYDMSRTAEPLDFLESFVIDSATVDFSTLGWMEAPRRRTGLRVTGETLYFEVESDFPEGLTIYKFPIIYKLKKPK